MQLNVNWNSIPKLEWTGDESLKQLHFDLEHRLRDVKVVSFDFFDTLVCRFAAEPVAVFIEIGRRLIAEKLLPPHYTPDSFQQLRIFAEEQCRARRTSEGALEISLEEIYGEMREVLSNWQRAARIEVETECEFCYVNPMTFGLLKHAKEKGLKVIVLSDIYLSSAHLKEILKANEVDSSILDLLLTSRDEGVCKGTGDLFKLASKKLGIKPTQFVHIGDNYHADVQGARLAGARGYHYYRTTPLTDKIYDRERTLGDKGSAYSLDSVRLMARRMCPAGPESDFRKEGAFLLGPVMASYAAWSVETFKELRIRNVVALMREGELLARLMKQYADSIGYELTLHPVFVSRQATNLASLGKLTPEIFLQRSQRRSKINVRDLFKGFGLKEEEFSDCGIPLDRTIASTFDLVEVSRFIFSPEIKDKVEQRSAAKRAELLGYIKPFIAKGEKNGLVDLGWGGTIQRNLQHAFDLENWNVTLTGCYLATNRGASVQILNGLDVRSYLGFLGAPSHLLQAFLRSPEIVEQSLSACMGSTLEYTKSGNEFRPVLDENRNTGEESRQKYAFQEGVILFQQLLLSLAKCKASIFRSPQALQDINRSLFPILTRLIAFPLEQEALRYGKLNHDDNFGSSSWQPICGDGSRKILREEGLVKFIGNNDYWPQGVLAGERAGLGETYFSYENLFSNLRTGKSYKNPEVDISIILVCESEADLLKKSLDSILENLSGVCAQVVIMENGADESVSKVIQAYSAKSEHMEAVLVKKRQGACQCRNQAVKHAKAQILYFINPGYLLETGEFSSLAAEFDRHQGLGLICKQGSTFDGEGDAVLVVRKVAFEEVEGFDLGYSTVFGYIDLIKRLQRQGWQAIHSLESEQAFATSPLALQEQARARDRWEAMADVSFGHGMPLVSIIIPVYNKSHLTRCCLTKIARHTTGDYEVIVVDNGSMDDTREMLENMQQASSNFKALFNDQNKGFSAACNLGARAARGKYFMFLNNDTEVLPGWLESLVEICELDCKVAVCGSKLLYADQTIQHGGVWLSRVDRVDPLSATHAHVKQPASYPPANELQKFSAVTAACMLVAKDKFNEVKGFDEGYWNGYEDIDLCLQFKRKGWLCVYQPKSVVIHLESQSGSERFRAVTKNVERFHKKWLGKVEPEIILDARGKWIDGKDSAVKPYRAPLATNGIESMDDGGKISIIILAMNQLEHTRRCIDSIWANTSEPIELLLIDNNSGDGTWAYFQELSNKHENVKAVHNSRNVGFAAGNNQGLALATGDFVVFLNNDTVVTNQWLGRMRKVYEACPDAGLVGPVSNCVSGPQLVLDANYSKPGALKTFADNWAENHSGKIAAANRLVGFCLMAKRSVINEIGGLDERFGSGNFEDDDYCLRASAIGFRCYIALDCFIHHVGSQTFKGAKINYSKAMHRNWRLFKSKWNIDSRTPIESGYSVPLILNQGEEMRVGVPDMESSHRRVSRCLLDRTNYPAPGTIALPPSALKGNLLESRELFKSRKWNEAWVSTCEAIECRPFHPEAFHLLAQIANTAGDVTTARRMCVTARDMAPEWSEPQKFLKGLAQSSRPPIEWPKTPTKAGARLTVCFIARNEEKFLAEALASVGEIAHQIIVVDTGSTDRTREIAASNGAEVFHRDWIHDFSDARNYCLEKAIGDWVLVLDADEELTAGAAESLMAEMSNPKAIAYRLPLEDKGLEKEGNSYVPRLFRNAPGLFYVGRVHEQIFSSIEVRREMWGLENLLGKTQLLHKGYQPEVVKERKKIERNLALLIEALKELPGEPNLLMNLGLELVRSGKLRQGIDYYYEALENLESLPKGHVVPELWESMVSQLATHLIHAKRFAEVVELFKSPAAGVFAMSASMHFSKGLAALQTKEFEIAREAFSLCLNLRQKKTLVPLNKEILTIAPFHCLGMALNGLGKMEEAIEAFEKGLQGHPGGNRTVQVDLAKIYFRKNEPVKALEILHSLTLDLPTDPEIWVLGSQVALSQPSFLEFALDWTSEAVRYCGSNAQITEQRGMALLCNQQCSEALQSFAALQRPSPAVAASIILCQLSMGLELRGISALEEVVVSSEFIRVYKQLISFNSSQVLRNAMEGAAVLGKRLPSAARIMERIASEVCNSAA